MNNTRSNASVFFEIAKELGLAALFVFGVLIDIIGAMCEGAAIASLLDD